MNKIKNRVLAVATPLLAAAGYLASAMFAKAETYSTSTLSTTFGNVLSDIVQSIIGVVVSFLSTNLPVIVVLGVCISFVFWLIYKARSAGHGG
jgi:hypothetical protein